MAADSPRRRVLIACWSKLEVDPRILRQIRWLSDVGWIVDTLGEGATPGPEVRTHFSMAGEPRWLGSRFVKGLMLVLLPFPARFRSFVEARIPRAATFAVARGEYDLIVVNDIDFLPWAIRTTTAARRVREMDAHLDLHEYHTRDLPDGTSLRPLMNGYWRWLRRKIASPAFTTRSTVANGIADLYASEFGVARPSIVRNCPDYVDQQPSSVSDDRVRLLYHGNAAWERGLRPLMDSVPLLDERFRLTMMLTGDPAVKLELEAMAATSNGRVEVIAPVPMSQVSLAINSFDLEIMVYPPDSENLRFALPNKLFEAIQGRLGLVIGNSPSMTELVGEFDNGVMVDGWEGQDVARAINGLTRKRITEMKNASHACAGQLNSEVEGTRFLQAIVRS